MTIYAVNGKEPIAAWIPSLDTAGNGTTTLTDLVGSNNGALTNMDAATDWVSDTSNGGVRALDFDGVNDYVDLGPTLTPSRLTWSIWIKTTGFNKGILSDANAASFSNSLHVTVAGKAAFRIGTTQLNGTSDVDDATWHHVVATYDLSAMKVYVDGNLENSISKTNAISWSANLILGQYFSSLYVFEGRLDDFRFFDTALDATDIAYLYNSGNGRGIVATTPNTRRRRYAGGYGL
jgi:hypothetical protein